MVCHSLATAITTALQSACTLTAMHLTQQSLSAENNTNGQTGTSGQNSGEQSSGEQSSGEQSSGEQHRRRNTFQTPEVPPGRRKPEPTLTSAASRISELITKRLGKLPSWVVLTQLFIGLGWLRAAGAKAIDLSWWSGEYIRRFAADHQDVTLGWYQPFLDNVVLPAVPLVALVVILGQVFAGLTLVSGRYVGAGLAVGILLNLQFLAAGAVDPSAFYLLAQGAMALWLAEGSRTAQTDKRLMVAASIAVFLGALSLPFISTLHPARVIEDPAIMFAFGGALAAMACLIAGKAFAQPGPSTDRTAHLAPDTREKTPHSVQN